MTLHRFVKHYRAHLSPILSLAVSADGRLAATVAADGQMLAAGGYKDNVKGSVKVFDIENFGAPPLPALALALSLSLASPVTRSVGTDQ